MIWRKMALGSADPSGFVLDSSKQERARAYAGKVQSVSLIEISFGGGVIAVLLINGGFRAIEGFADIPLPLLVLSLAVSFLLMGFLTSAYLRRLESIADVWMLRLTGNKGAFISVMTRLANQSLFDAKSSQLVEILHDHPSCHKRVGQARNYRSAGEVAV
jgi:Zn-dependent protease with chaperone function